MKKISILILLVSVFFQAKSQVSFYADYNSGCAPFTVNFYNTSGTGVHYDWNFGDGNSLIDSYNATHTFTTPGVYYVSMDAFEAGYTGYLGSHSEMITVYGAPPNLNKSASVSCPYEMIYFENPKSSSYYSWDFGDGTTITTTDPYYNHTYTSTGIFTVTCQYFDWDCGLDLVIYDQVEINSGLPHFGGFPYISASETTICPGSEIYLWAGGGTYTGYNWDFGNGNFGSGQDVSQQYNSVGVYTASVQLYNGCGVDTTIIQIIDVNNSVPAPNVTIDGAPIVCIGENVYFTSYSAPYLNFTWNFDDGSPLYNTDDNYAYHSYSTAGNYVIEVLVENLCGNTSLSTFDVEASTSAPLFDTYLDIYPNVVCPGDEFQYYVPWQYDYYINFGDGTGETEGNSHSYSAPGVYPVYVILQNSCGTTETIYQNVYVQDNLPMPSNVYVSGYPNPACPGEGIEFYGSGGFSEYAWTFGDGYTSTAEYVTHPYVNPGSYPVSLTLTNGCGADTTLYMVANVASNLPIDDFDFSITGNEVCPGTTVYMAGDTDGLTYSWDFGDGSTSDEMLTSHVYNSLGTYSVTLSAVNGCGADTTVTFDIDVMNGLVPDLTQYNFEAQSPGCIGDNLYFAISPAGVGTYSWDFGDGNSGFSDQPLFVEGQPFVVGFHSYDAVGTYNAVLTVTNTCGNSADSTVVVEVGGLGSNTPVSVYFWTSDTQTTCEGQPVSFIAVGASTYVWDFGDGTGNLITYNSLIAVDHIYSQDGSYTVTLLGYNSCGNSDNNQEEIFIPDSKIEVLTNTVFDADCGENNGIAIASASGGTQPYTYSWTNGDQSILADSLGSGIYVVTVTDHIGCSAEAIAAVSDNQGPVILLENIVHNTCFGQDNGVISVSVLGGAPPYTILWSNGDATEDIFNLEAGPYEIFVTDANGCFAAQSFTIEQPIESIVSVLSQPATCNLNNGAATASVSNGTGPFNFIWPNTSGSSNVAGGLAPGVHDLMIIDGNLCLLQTTFVVNEENGAIIVTDSIADPTCSGDLSAIYISTIGGTGPFNYSWSDGSTDQDLTNVLPGEYSVEVEGADGCSSFQLFNVEMTAPEEPQICIVTVDTTTNSNLVVWNALADPNVVSYNIYKESSQSGLYFLVANQSADSLSQYYDYPSNPAIRSWRYKVSAIDDCGNESDLSDPHKTIHLTSNLGVGGVVNLIWDHYNGFSYDTYYIHRYHPSTGWMIIDSLGSLNISYTDLTPPSDSNLVYMIENRPPSICTATKAQDHNSSRSNKSSINAPDFGEPTGISEMQNGDLKMYPNPTSGLVQISFLSDISEIRIFDISGQLVYASMHNSQTVSVDCSEFARGVYTVQINTEQGTLYNKLVKQ